MKIDNTKGVGEKGAEVGGSKSIIKRQVLTEGPAVKGSGGGRWKSKGHERERD